MLSGSRCMCCKPIQGRMGRVVLMPFSSLLGSQGANTHSLVQQCTVWISRVIWKEFVASHKVGAHRLIA